MQSTVCNDAKRPSSLQQVAERAKLSVRTVSYILNGNRSDLFRPETREAVVRAAEQLGYRSNSAAKAVRQGRFGAIGLLQSTSPRDAGLSPFTLLAMESELMKRGQRLVVSMVCDDHLRSPERLPQLLREWSVDGLLIAYTANAPSEFQSLLDRFGVPAVWMNTKYGPDSVYPDDQSAAYEATRRFTALGHREILYATFAASEHYSAADRSAGYGRAMADAGLDPLTFAPPEAVQARDRLALARRLIDGEPVAGAVGRTGSGPTAVITYGGADEVLPFLFACREPGRRRVALVGFGDGPIDQAGIPVATMHIPTYRVGQEAVQMLSAKLATGEPAVSTTPVGRAVSFMFSAGDTLLPPE